MQSIEVRTKVALTAAVLIFAALRVWLQFQTVRTLSLPVAGIGFATFLAIGLVAARGGIDSRKVVQWGLLATLGSFLFDITMGAIIAPCLPNPGSRFHLLTSVLDLFRCFFTVGLPVAIGTSIHTQGRPKPAPRDVDPTTPKEPVAPMVLNALLIGLLPLMHIGLLMRGAPGRLDVPLYGILFITIPIGAVMALVGVFLCAGLSKHGVTVLLATLFYGIGAVLAFGGLYLLGAKFSIPP
ncbi:MAG TPA: hypothetical protein PLX06_06060 [Fimbriimonadaceae bacterium]|nr:hypothetical protein [Fimbriimonadaceae bacterium]